MEPQERHLIGHNVGGQEAVATYEAMAKKWTEQKKPSKIAGSFSKLSDLQEIHLNHFKNAPYLWKPLSGGTVWGGMLMDDNLDYIHLVLASQEVVEYLIDKEKVDWLLNEYKSNKMN
jgi:hypothetical protein